MFRGQPSKCGGTWSNPTVFPLGVLTQETNSVQVCGSPDMWGWSVYVSRRNFEAPSGSHGASTAKLGSLDEADASVGERGELSKARRSHQLTSWKKSLDRRTAECLNLRSRFVTSLFSKFLYVLPPSGAARQCVLLVSVSGAMNATPSI